MKTLLLPILILISFLSFSQNFHSDDITDAEAKAATG